MCIIIESFKRWPSYLDVTSCKQGPDALVCATCIKIWCRAQQELPLPFRMLLAVSLYMPVKFAAYSLAMYANFLAATMHPIVLQLDLDWLQLRSHVNAIQSSL